MTDEADELERRTLDLIDEALDLPHEDQHDFLISKTRGDEKLPCLNKALSLLQDLPEC